MSKETIYREDAINLCEKWRNRTNEHHDKNGWYIADTILKTIKELPSADRPQEWIPCSERLPEKDGYYLVSLAFEWGNETEMGWLLDGEWANSNSYVTIAWMPLPKPWKGADDDSKRA